VAIAAAASSATNAAARPDLRLDPFDLLVRPVILSGVGMSIPFLVLAFLSPAPDTPIAQAGVGMCDQCPGSGPECIGDFASRRIHPRATQRIREIASR
jgi:hypothetical protein